jgi:hypothetical protein
MKNFGFINDEWQDGEARGRTFVAGMPGYGKTTEIARLLNQCRGRALFIDPEAKHKSFVPKYTLCHQPFEAEQVLRRNGRVIYQPKAGDLGEHFRVVCSMAYIMERCVIAVDEMDKFCGPEWGPKNMPPILYDIVNYGRHHKVSLVYSSREPMRVARGVVSSSGEMRLFHFDEDDYVNYFRKRLGIRVTADVLRSLPKYQYLHWKNDGSAPTIENAGRVVKTF